MQNNAEKHKKSMSSGAKTGVRTSKVDSGKLKLMITVVNREKGDYYADLIQSFDVNMQLVVRANGTASPQMLGLLGLADAERTAIFSVVREDRCPQILSGLKDKFRTIKNGKGVAVTVPLSSVMGVAIYGFLSNDPRTVRDEKKEEKK